MPVQGTAEFQSAIAWFVPVIIATALLWLLSLMKEPARRYFMAILVGGAGSAYLSSGGLGKWDLVFCAAMSFVAYRGLQSYPFLGIGWLMHTGWDILHHLHGSPVLPFDPTSSLGCAICDPVLAIWCFAGGPSLYQFIRRKRAAAPRPA